MCRLTHCLRCCLVVIAFCTREHQPCDTKKSARTPSTRSSSELTQLRLGRRNPAWHSRDQTLRQGDIRVIRVAKGDQSIINEAAHTLSRHHGSTTRRISHQWMGSQSNQTDQGQGRRSRWGHFQSSIEAPRSCSLSHQGGGDFKVRAGERQEASQELPGGQRHTNHASQRPRAAAKRSTRVQHASFVGFQPVRGTIRPPQANEDAVPVDLATKRKDNRQHLQTSGAATTPEAAAMLEHSGFAPPPPTAVLNQAQPEPCVISLSVEQTAPSPATGQEEPVAPEAKQADHAKIDALLQSPQELVTRLSKQPKGSRCMQCHRDNERIRS